MRTSLLDDAQAARRRIGALLEDVDLAMLATVSAAPGVAHTTEATKLAALTVQLRSEAHGLATYAGAAAAVR